MRYSKCNDYGHNKINCQTMSLPSLRQRNKECFDPLMDALLKASQIPCHLDFPAISILHGDNDRHSDFFAEVVGPGEVVVVTELGLLVVAAESLLVVVEADCSCRNFFIQKVTMKLIATV